MRLIVWKCDGCGWTQDGEKNPFLQMRVTIEGPHPSVAGVLGGELPKSVTEALYKGPAIDLCEGCKGRLFEAVRVQDWKKDKECPKPPMNSAG